MYVSKINVKQKSPVNMYLVFGTSLFHLYEVQEQVKLMYHEKIRKLLCEDGRGGKK